MKKILCFYPGPLDRPNLDHVAGATRLKHLAKLMEKAGYQVECLGLDAKALQLGFFKANQPVLEALNQHSFDILLVYGTSLKYAWPLFFWCHKHHKKLWVSINEWGRWTLKSSLSWLLLKAGIHFSILVSDRLILISKAMVLACPKKKSVLIPTIFPGSDRPLEKPLVLEKPIRLFYAGSIKNKKDDMATFISALSSYPHKDHFVLTLVGPSAKDLDPVDAPLVFKPFMEPKDLEKEWQDQHFSLLFRPNLAYAKYGFPTKVGQSYYLGVPVLANKTSDLADYIHSDNGILLEDSSIASIHRGLDQILAMTEEGYALCRKRAYDQGQDFVLESYVERVKDHD